MAAPRNEVIQVSYQNPHATKPLFLPVLVISNTSDEQLASNIKTNAARDLEWVKAEEPHERHAVIVGGGPSIADTLDEIVRLQNSGAAVFAMNGASSFLTEKGFPVDYQVMVDAKPETSTLVDPLADEYLLASQCHPKTFEEAQGGKKVWHLAIDGIESNFPAERVTRGGYALIGGGATVGNSALCLAYAMGYRTLHIFGFDSCHRGEESHAYPQAMNRFIPCVDVMWNGKAYHASVAMKAQAERFQSTARSLKDAGCMLHVYGDGLLQAMFRTPVSDLDEREKYVRMWAFDSYRELSPGEHAVPEFLKIVKPDGLIVDFGCGTGRASVALSKSGHDVFLVDFADNCRDQEALELPFLEWDLRKEGMPVTAEYGFCADVMEHIPTEDVEAVISNIMQSAKQVFFQISTVADCFGKFIGTPLHLTVRSHEWWLSFFQDLGLTVRWAEDLGNASRFVVIRGY